jgi:hypothetical protein
MWSYLTSHGHVTDYVAKHQRAAAERRVLSLFREPCLTSQLSRNFSQSLSVNVNVTKWARAVLIVRESTAESAALHGEAGEVFFFGRV